jgi:(p)ppGpp synthase/HD superfamily hydrolase
MSKKNEKLKTKNRASEKSPHVVLTDKYAQAVAYASAIHATDTRKGTNIAYMSHLLGVSSLVIEAGGDEDEAIAGLLHDAVEDAGGRPRLEDIRARFGKKVAKIVLACSDSTDEEWKKSVDYWERKKAYLDHLEDPKTDERAVLVSIADKTHNARAIVTDLERTGYKVLTKFNGTPEEILKYYAECLRIGTAKNVPGTLTIPLGLAVEKIREYVEAGGK